MEALLVDTLGEQLAKEGCGVQSRQGWYRESTGSSLMTSLELLLQLLRKPVGSVVRKEELAAVPGIASSFSSGPLPPPPSVCARKSPFHRHRVWPRRRGAHVMLNPSVFPCAGLSGRKPDMITLLENGKVPLTEGRHPGLGE